MGAMFHDWSTRGKAFRSGFAALDLAYGTRADEMLDLYRPPKVVRPPLWIFIHGGYWQSCTKNQHAQFTAGMVRNGFAVANIDYPLAPLVDLGTIARSVTAAIRFLVAEADALDIDRTRLHVAGHSAGGYLAALAALDRNEPPSARRYSCPDCLTFPLSRHCRSGGSWACPSRTVWPNSLLRATRHRTAFESRSE
jgi:arylformamidase